MGVLSAIAITAQRLNIADVIRTAERQRNNMVFGQSGLLTAHGTSASEQCFQKIPIGFRVATFSPMFCGVTSCFKVGYVRLMTGAIISVVNLFRFTLFAHASVGRLFIKWACMFEYRVTILRTKMMFLASKCRWLVLIFFATCFAFGKEVGAISLPNLAPCFWLTWNVQSLSCHALIISQKYIYENPELLTGVKKNEG